MDNGKASCSHPPLLITQYYKHHFTTATNISLANYLPHHQCGCTEVAALNSHQSALIFQAVMEGRAGGWGTALKHVCPHPICSIPSFLGDGITPLIHKHTQSLSLSTNPFITHPLCNAEAIRGAIQVSAMVPQPFAAPLPLSAPTDPCCQPLCFPGKHRWNVSICLMC